MTGNYDGLLLINKEPGYTSSDVVAKLRGILRQKKIGHTGTLDPEATGLLVICLGKATRVAELLTAHEKEYIAVVKLGVTTDTQDMTGRIVSEGDASFVTHEILLETLGAFKGSYEQIPPMYSAVKVNGERLYKMAREGRTVERKPRTVTISAISIMDDERLASDHEFTMEVRCSKGTYIRTLCDDIGTRLGCGAAMAALIRTAVGSFRLENASSLSEVERARDEGTLDGLVLGIEDLFRDMDRVEVDPDFFTRLTNGNGFSPDKVISAGPADENDTLTDEERYRDGEIVRAYCGGIWFGLYKYSAVLKQFRVEKFFYDPA